MKSSKNSLVCEILCGLGSFATWLTARQRRSHAWFEDPLQQGVTTVKGQHITQLRDNLDPALSALGFSAGGYTDPILVLGTTTVKKVHVDELRQRVK